MGNRTRVKVVKNKMALLFREVEFDILYGKGISRSGDVLDLAVEAGIVEKSGSWFSYDGERLGQGREKVRTHLDENPQLIDELAAKVLAKHGLAPSPSGPPDKPEETAKPDPKAAPTGGSPAARGNGKSTRQPRA